MIHSYSKSEQHGYLYRSTDETDSVEEVNISGTLPQWLQGTFMRNGPGRFDFVDGFKVNHWFDGYSIISKFHIIDGKVRFEKRFLQSDAYKRVMKNNRPCVCEFGTPKYSDSTKNWVTRLYNSIFHKINMGLPAVPEFTDNANMSLFNLGRNVFAIGETCFFYDINMSTLSPGQKYDTNKIFGMHVSTPHPLTDQFGNTFNIGSCYAPTLKYCVVKIPATNEAKDPKLILKKAQTICSIPSRWNRNILSYNHSFGITENYVVFIEQPYVVNLNKILASVLIKGQCFKDWAEWNPEYKNRFYIIDKKSGKLVGCSEFFSQEAFFFIHIINCYEEKGQVVITLSSYEDPTILDTQFLSMLRQCSPEGNSPKAKAAAHQYVVPINIKNLQDAPTGNLIHIDGSKALAFRKGSRIILVPEILTKRGMEFPVINKRYNGRKHRFYYASGLSSLEDFKNAAVKVDITTKKTICWRESDYHLVGEPCFVPNPNASYDDLESEDDGILICPVSDSREHHNDKIVFLDAKNMTFLAHAEFSHQIPPAIHGLFMPPC